MNPSRPAAPESDTPEPIARWSGGICKTCGNYTHSCKCNHPKSPLLDELFSTKTAPTPCPTCGGLRERHLERQLALAQTELKGHMRVEDELKERAARVADERDFLERNYKRIEAKLAQAQSRIAALEKELAELHREWGADILAATDLRQDAARYRWLREHFRFSHDNLHELWFDEDISPHAAVTIASREELDSTIDEAALKSRA